mgnify:CR=1 FL=1
MSLKQDRTGTRTSEDLRRRINIKGIDEAVKETDINNKTVKEMETRVNGMSESLDNTRKNYVSTQTQTFTEEQTTMNTRRKAEQYETEENFFSNCISSRLYRHDRLCGK